MADKIRTCGPKLRVAFQNHLVSLCDLLLAEYLITNDNASELRNTAQSEPYRASRMLEFIRNRVASNEENYQAFVKALQKDRQYRDILKILGEKCPEPTVSRAAATSESQDNSAHYPTLQYMSEHQKILMCGPKLRVAFQGHLVSLCDLLLANFLITSDNASELKNTTQPEPNRASRMVQFVRNKVLISKDNYYVFVKALQTDHQYRDILKILGEKCPQPTGSPAAAPATSKFEVNLPGGRFVANDVIQSHYAKVTEVISQNVDRFGALLVECKCFPDGSVTDIVDTTGISKYKKATQLLQIVNSRIKTAQSKDNARQIFDCLVMILDKELEHSIGQTLVTAYQSKDPSYINPLPSVECAQASCITPGQDTQKPKDDSMVVLGSQAISTPEKPAENYSTQVEDTNATSKIIGQPESTPPKASGDASEKLQIAVSENHGPIQVEQEMSPSRSTSFASSTQMSQESEQNDVGPMQPTSESEGTGVASTMQSRIESDTGPPNETTPEKEAAIASPPSQPGAGAESCAAMQKKLEYLNLEGVEPKKATFSVNMSEEEFHEFLKGEGLCRKDCEIIADNGFSAKKFAQYFSEEDRTGLNFTVVGKRILRRLLQDLSNPGRKDPSYQRPLPTFAEECEQSSVEETERPKDNEEPKYTEEDLVEIAESKNPIATPDGLHDSLAAFISQVVVLLHTVKDEEMIAALKHLSPPVEQSDRPIRWFLANTSFILGIFGGHKAALVQTSKAADCRHELVPALRSLPNAQLIIALGYAYGLKSKCKLGDVLVSTCIDGIGNIRLEHGRLKFDEGRVQQTSMSTRALNVFTKGFILWRNFICSTEGRKTKVVAGSLISSPVLLNGKDALDEYLKNNERYKGGEMEGQEVARAQLTLKEEDKREVDFIVIKGVADFGDGSTIKGWQLTATLAAASYAEEKLRESGGNVYNSDDTETSPTTPPVDATQSGSRGDQLLTSSELNLLNIVLAKFSPQLKERGLNLDSALREKSVITKEKVVLCLQEIGQDASELAEILRDKGLGKLQEYMFESVYKQALKDEQYHVRLHAFKMILCGVPRSGKSTFWQRIAVKDFKPSVVSASTRGMESHCLSAVESKECAHMQTKVLFDLQLYSETDTSDLDKEALCIYKHILENHKDSSTPKSGASSKQPGFSSEETIPSDNSLPESDNVAMNEPDVPSHTIVRSKESSRNSYPDQISEEIRRHFEDLNTLLKEKEVDDKAIIGVVKKLCHLIDAGGQRAYLELLPTLVVGRALYLLFFSYEEFEKELNETVQVEDNPTEVNTGTKYKQMDVIMKSLICVSTTTSRCGSSDVPHSSGKASTTKDKSHSGNVAMLVGTHADKVSKEEIERVDKLVREKVKPFLNCGSLVFAKTGTKLPLAVGLEKSDTSTEYSYNPNDYKEVIMKIVDDRLTSPEFHSLPASWYMFSMVLRRLQHAGNSVLKYSHCQEIARELHINDEQLNGLLHRLQNILGIVLYFPDVEGVKDIVICDPSLIYKGISEIILKSFDKSTADEHYLKLKKHGLFSEKILKKYSKCEEKEGQLKIDQLMIILEHLGIIAPVSSSESKLVEENCYIIPCRLDDAPPEHLGVKIQNGQACSIVPLRIYFKCGYPPMGGFCYLFTKLINKKGWVPLLPDKFSSKSDMIYFRNKVTFKVSGHYFVTFLSTDRYYEIHILHTHQKFKIGVDGHSICKIVWDAVSDVLSQSNNTCLREYETGCQCQRCEDYDEHGMIFACDPGDQVTAKCRKDVYETTIIVGEEKQSLVVWFKEPKDCREYCLGEKVELSINIGSDVKFDTDTDKYCYKWLADGDIPNQTYNQRTLCIDKFEDKHKGIYECIVSTASGPTLSVSSELHLDLKPYENFHPEMAQRAFMSFLNANGFSYKICEELDRIEFTAKDANNNFTSWEKELKKVVSDGVFMKLKDLVCKVSVPEKKGNTPPPPLQQSKSGCIWWILILILLLMAICVGVVYTLNSFGVITISGGVSTYKVQDENTIFKDQSCHKIGNLHNLEQAVQRIGNWKGLCRNLGVNEETMEMLEFANDHDLEKKHKCLKAFCDKEQATWTEVIRAVYEFPISNKRVARDIAETYNISIQIFEKFKSDEL